MKPVIRLPADQDHRHGVLYRLDPMVMQMISMNFIPCLCLTIECKCGRIDGFLTYLEKCRDDISSIDAASLLS